MAGARHRRADQRSLSFRSLFYRLQKYKDLFEVASLQSRAGLPFALRGAPPFSVVMSNNLKRLEPLLMRRTPTLRAPPGMIDIPGCLPDSSRRRLELDFPQISGDRSGWHIVLKSAAIGLISANLGLHLVYDSSPTIPRKISSKTSSKLAGQTNPPNLCCPLTTPRACDRVASSASAFCRLEQATHSFVQNDRRDTQVDLLNRRQAHICLLAWLDEANILDHSTYFTEVL